jgi:molybdenum ABC transporter, periplasmic molybdate-binding protein
LVLVIVFWLVPGCRTTTQTKELHVAAAADLIPAFEELGRQFEASHKTKVVFSFGSTGLLTRQIENGAPMDVFAAASVDFINELEQKGLILPDSKSVYARGRITLWTRKDSQLKVEKINDLGSNDVKRIVIANPDHAPYGTAAREALQAAGIWDAVKEKLVYGDNIRQTLQFAETGNVDVAIVALSLSKQSDGQWTLIPAELHKPINQALAVIKGTKDEPTARAFADFIAGPDGQSILAKYGFEQVK